MVWDEAQRAAGKNADYHRQDLYDAIESGNYPEWELNLQIINEDQALAFGFDVFDPTKIIPEEHAPLFPVGVMRLDANPANYFAETEQVMVRLVPSKESRPTRKPEPLAHQSFHGNNSSNPATLYEVSTLPRILSCRAASSRTWTLS